jgi:16S rRNA C967 or C1407 C5-methylase (RsmB/RsmF family)
VKENTVKEKAKEMKENEEKKAVEKQKENELKNRRRRTDITQGGEYEKGKQNYQDEGQ